MPCIHIPCPQNNAYFLRILMEKGITSKHEDGCLMGKEVRNEKREMKETADHESRDGGNFRSG